MVSGTVEGHEQLSINAKSLSTVGFKCPKHLPSNSRFCAPCNCPTALSPRDPKLFRGIFFHVGKAYPQQAYAL